MSCLNWRSGPALGLNQFLCERLPEGDNNVGFQSCLLGTSVRRQWLQPISLPHISTWGTMDQNVILMRTKFCFWIGEIMNEFLKFNPIDWWIGSDPGYHPITYNGTDLNGRLNLCLLATRPNVASSTWGDFLCDTWSDRIGHPCKILCYIDRSLFLITLMMYFWIWMLKLQIYDLSCKI